MTTLSPGCPCLLGGSLKGAWGASSHRAGPQLGRAALTGVSLHERAGGKLLGFLLLCTLLPAQELGRNIQEENIDASL